MTLLLTMEPTERYATRKAIDELAEELNMRNEPWMQDWPYEVVVASDIEKYIGHYEKLSDEDKMFVLMQAIIQAIEEQTDKELFLKYWSIVRPMLEKDFNIHEYTVYYWCCFDNENIDDCFGVSLLMRQLWADMTKQF